MPVVSKRYGLQLGQENEEWSLTQNMWLQGHRQRRAARSICGGSAEEEAEQGDPQARGCCAGQLCGAATAEQLCRFPDRLAL